MKAVRYSILVLSVVGLLSLASSYAALAGGCTSCGCESCQECPKGCGKFQCECPCDKVCEPKCATKKVTTICWECVCKKVCLAGKSCGCQGTCGKSRVVKHLVRRTITHEVPIVQCEAVDAAGCGCDTTSCSNAPLPPSAAPSVRRETIDDRASLDVDPQRRSIFSAKPSSSAKLVEKTASWVPAWLRR